MCAEFSVDHTSDLRQPHTDVTSEKVRTDLLKLPKILMGSFRVARVKAPPRQRHASVTPTSRQRCVFYATLNVKITVLLALGDEAFVRRLGSSNIMRKLTNVASVCVCACVRVCVRACVDALEVFVHVDALHSHFLFVPARS